MWKLISGLSMLDEYLRPTCQKHKRSFQTKEDIQRSARHDAGRSLMKMRAPWPSANFPLANLGFKKASLEKSMGLQPCKQGFRVSMAKAACKPSFHEDVFRVKQSKSRKEFLWELILDFFEVRILQKRVLGFRWQRQRANPHSMRTYLGLSKTNLDRNSYGNLS